MTAACPEIERVDLHFERRLSPDGEAEMRRHMPGCSACRERYERQLLLERLDPHGAGAKARIASGLGFGGQPAKVLRFAAPAAGAVAVAAAIVLFVGRPSPYDDASFAARGADAGKEQGTSVYVYAARDGGASLAGATLRPNDDLVFEYENAAGKQWLMIFGVDEHRHVYWYYPAWMDPSEDPRSIAVHRTTTRQALPDAVRQEVDGADLDVRAVFSDAPLSVKTVERDIAAAPATATKYVTGSGIVESSTRFRVVRDAK